MMKILRENMRRFRTKNLNEQSVEVSVQDLINMFNDNPDLAYEFSKDSDDTKKVDFMNSLLYVVRGKRPETVLTAHISKNIDIVNDFVYHMRGR